MTECPYCTSKNVLFVGVQNTSSGQEYRYGCNNCVGIFFVKKLPHRDTEWVEKRIPGLREQ